MIACRAAAALALIAILALPGAQAQPAAVREEIDLNAGWSFALSAADGAPRTGDWQRVDLPHTWNAADSANKRNPYRRGVGQYRKDLRLPARFSGQQLYLYFEGANQVAEVAIDGQQVGRHEGGYTGFVFDVTGRIEPGRQHRIGVSVDNTHNDRIPPLEADFTFYGGIYRDVRLIAVDPTHFAFDEFGALDVSVHTESLDESEARIRVTAGIRNAADQRREVRVETSVRDAQGTELVQQSVPMSVESGSVATSDIAAFEIVDPSLWSPESPYLYRIRCRVLDGERVIDEVELPLGLRWFEADSERGFLLNGQPYPLAGTNRHQDREGFGNALSDDQHAEDLRRIREDGFNFLRLAHYPQDPAVLKAADEIGLIVWEEIPVVNRISQSAGFGDSSERMLREMIRQHRHHPSIAFWGTMNEVTLQRPDPEPEGYYEDVVKLARRLEAVAEAEDPTRLTVMALSRDEIDDDVPLEDITDVLAFNLYFGWYYDEFSTLGEFLDDYRAEHPARPLMISEYGAGSDRRVHSRSPARFDFSIEYQQEFHEANFAQVLDRPWLVGSAIWNHFDFGSNHRQDTMFAVNQKGLYDYDRSPKDVAFYYRAQLSDEPVLHIATRDWRHRVGSTDADREVPIRVYANAEAVSLFRNGEALGPKEVQNATALWHVVLADGVNEFTARAEGIEDRATIVYEDRGSAAARTAGSPTAPGGNSGDSGVDRRRAGDAKDVLFAVNAGGGEQVTDADGVAWEADREYGDGPWGHLGGRASRSHHRIFDTGDDALYQSQRSGNHSYRFDLSPGDYCVELLFSPLEEVVPDADFALRVDGSDVPVPTLAAFSAASVQRDVTVEGGDGLSVEFASADGDGDGAAFVNGIAVTSGRCSEPAGGARRAEDSSLPNVLFILADDIGYGDIGAYGGKLATPNIDALAASGMRFTDAHSPAALCAPSRFSLMTGSYPYRNGRPGGSWDLNFSSGFLAGAGHLAAGRHVTVGEVLQRAGYRTAFIGKMHFGGDAFDRSGQAIRNKDRLNQMDFARGIRNGIGSHGFDYAYGLASGIQHEPFAYFENGRYAPVDPADPRDNRSTVLLYNGSYAVGTNGLSEIVEAERIPARADRNYDSSQAGRRLTQRALGFIDDHAAGVANAGGGRPFALVFSSQAIHIPHTPPIDFDGDPSRLDEPVAGQSGGATTDMILELDRQVGALVEKLDAIGELDNTLIFFTSDNGALPENAVDYGDSSHDSNGPWRGYKASIYEGGHRVPFIVRWGDGTGEGSFVSPGRVSSEPIVNHDWVATMYDLTGQTMAVDQALDSASLLPLILGQSEDAVHEFMLYQAGFAGIGAIREGDLVLVIDETRTPVELYDLGVDPSQSDNLIEDPERRSTIERLRQRFLEHNDRDNSTFHEPRTTAPLSFGKTDTETAP